jgi:hypothetical protein
MCISYTIYINFLHCKIFFSKIFITTTFSKNPGIKPGMGIIFGFSASSLFLVHP